MERMILVVMVIITMVMKSVYSTCVPPPSNVLDTHGVDTIVYGTVVSVTSSRRSHVSTIKFSVSCRFKYSHHVRDVITIRAVAMNNACKRDLTTGAELVFYLSDSRDPSQYNSVVFPQPEVDSFASINEVDILRLRQYSYASGSLPKGDYCPEDCVTGSSWSGWSDCSEDCGSGFIQRHLEISENKLKGKVRCPAVTETAHCYLKPCGDPYNLNNNVNKWTETYMIIGSCQTTQPVRYLLCTELCEMGYSNKPTDVDIRPERVICGDQIKFKAVSVTLECGCLKDGDVTSDPLASLFDG
ncbi:uncharacterized protein LOC134824423 [Bolinopsis microptera]|uniref:uncharacterized protein LOC134824423 n=1 Tax=Bolinopsis microptera TaxID=2820187 RepID=UPI003079A64C